MWRKPSRPATCEDVEYIMKELKNNGSINAIAKTLGFSYGKVRLIIKKYNPSFCPDNYSHIKSLKMSEDAQHKFSLVKKYFNNFNIGDTVSAIIKNKKAHRIHKGLVIGKNEYHLTIKLKNSSLNVKVTDILDNFIKIRKEER